MKRFLSLAVLTLLVTSCFLFAPNIEFSDGITPAPAFTQAGGTQSFGIKATSDWTATSSESWCTVSPASGISGDFTLTVKALANDTPDARTATVQLQCGEVLRLFTVKQEQKDVLAVPVSTVEMGKEAGEFTVEVSANVPVSARVTKGEAWLSYQGTKGLQAGRHAFSVSANTGEDPRTGEVEFYNTEAGASVRVTVNQKAPDVFELSASETSVAAEGGSFTVTVRSSLSYSVSSMPDWVKEVSVKAVSTKVHTYEVAANPDQAERSGVIVFCNETGVCVPFTVNQEAAAAPVPQPSGVDWTKAFIHKSLIMRFTATWCGYCPIMAETIALAQTNRPGRFEVVNIHGGSSNLEFAGYRPLMTEYNISGYPTSVVDGRRMIENYTPSYCMTLVQNAQDETESTYPTMTAVGIASSFSGNSLSVDVDLYCKEADSYKVTVLLLEDGIIGNQADNYNGSHSDYRHDCVARIALTDVLGAAFSTVEANTVKSFPFKVDVPTQYVKENLRVLVYVQREFGSQQKLSDFKGSFYVDNAASAKAGEILAPAVK